MSEQRKSLDERTASNPILRERLNAILDIAENVDGKFQTGDEAEERTVDELQRFGNDLLHQWAKSREKQALLNVRGHEADTVGNGKKNSTGKRLSGK